jgi:hypothetical protein
MGVKNDSPGLLKAALMFFIRMLNKGESIPGRALALKCADPHPLFSCGFHKMYL